MFVSEWVCSENCKRRANNVNRLRHWQIYLSEPTKKKQKSKIRINVKLNVKMERFIQPPWMVDRHTWICTRVEGKSDYSNDKDDGFCNFRIHRSVFAVVLGVWCVWSNQCKRCQERGEKDDFGDLIYKAHIFSLATQTLTDFKSIVSTFRIRCRWNDLFQWDNRGEAKKKRQESIHWHLNMHI